MPPIPLPPLLAIALAVVLAMPALRAHADCIDAAAARHQVDARVLRAIGWQESGLQPAALGRNRDGSIDVGAFQINSVHFAELARHGIDRAALADGCTCAEVAAWHYRRQVELHGDNWQAVGAYHSHTRARAHGYANRIAAILMRWHAIPAGPPPFPAEPAPALSRAPAAPLAAAPAAPTEAAPPVAPGRAVFGVIPFLPSVR